MKATAAVRENLRRGMPAALFLGTALGLLTAECIIRDWDVPRVVPGSLGLGLSVGCLLAMAAAPGVVLGYRLLGRGGHSPRSSSLLGQVFAWGVLVGPFAGWGEYGADYLIPYSRGHGADPGLFVYTFLVVGLLEELAKFLVVWRLAYRIRAFREVYDGVLYCTVSALGFATMENIFYVLTAGPDAVGVAVGRAFTAVPTHVAYGAIMGYAMGRAREARSKTRKQEWLFVSLAGPILLHGAYDFFLMAGSDILLLFLPVMVGGWVLACRGIKRALRDSPFTRCVCHKGIPRVVSFCPHCGKARRTEINCDSCGTPVSKWGRRCLKCASRIRRPWHLRPDRLREFFPGQRFVVCGSCRERTTATSRFCMHCGKVRRGRAAVRRARGEVRRG